jgi:hypothetical protein
MNPFLGVFFHWLGGLASGSFYVPYKGVRKWAWEVYWLTGGNVYCNGAEPYATESNPLILPHTNPINVTTHTPNPTLQLQLGPELQSAPTQLINSTTLGHARVPDLPYVNPDNSPLKFNRDTQDKRRNPSHPTPGPFEIPANSSALFIEL